MTHIFADTRRVAAGAGAANVWGYCHNIREADAPAAVVPHVAAVVLKRRRQTLETAVLVGFEVVGIPVAASIDELHTLSFVCAERPARDTCFAGASYTRRLHARLHNKLALKPDMCLQEATAACRVDRRDCIS
jgi:hypothetical protein